MRKEKKFNVFTYGNEVLVQETFLCSESLPYCKKFSSTLWIQKFSVNVRMCEKEYKCICQAASIFL